MLAEDEAARRTRDPANIAKLHLGKALDDDVSAEKNYHIRQALQALTALQTLTLEE